MGGGGDSRVSLCRHLLPNLARMDLRSRQLSNVTSPRTILVYLVGAGSSRPLSATPSPISIRFFIPTSTSYLFLPSGALVGGDLSCCMASLKGGETNVPNKSIGVLLAPTPIVEAATSPLGDGIISSRAGANAQTFSFLAQHFQFFFV